MYSQQGKMPFASDVCNPDAFTLDYGFLRSAGEIHLNLRPATEATEYRNGLQGRRPRARRGESLLNPICQYILRENFREGRWLSGRVIGARDQAHPLRSNLAWRSIPHFRRHRFALGNVEAFPEPTKNRGASAR